MKRKFVRVLSTILSFAILFSVFALYVSADDIKTNTHTILTRRQDGTVVSEQFRKSTTRSNVKRIKNAYFPEHILENSEPTRGLVSSQIEVNAHNLPYSAIGYIVSYFDEDGNGTPETSCTGTGFLEAEDIMLTAAHVVYNTTLHIWAHTVLFYPAQNGLSDIYRTYYEAEAIEISISQDFVNEDLSDDWAICQLDRNLGDEFGYLGLAGSPTQADIGMSLTLSGYPQQSVYVDHGYQAKTTGTILRVKSENYFVASNYIAFGHSGSPLYDSDGVVYGIGADGIPRVDTNGNPLYSMDSNGNFYKVEDTGAVAFSPWLFDLVIDHCDESAARWN